MTKEEYTDLNLIAAAPGTGECVIREHTVTVQAGGIQRTLTCTGSYVEELVRGFECTGKPDNEPQIRPISWTPEQIHRLAETFLSHEGIHTYTSATHLAILAQGGVILSIMEDISRHCAIDKVIGYAIINGIDLSECMIYSSGRVQYDTVMKLVRAGVPMLVSKSSPTYEAIELAADHGITLIGRAWPDGYTVFT